MEILVLDTNILIDHVHGHASWLGHLLNQGNAILIVPTIVVAEYLVAQEVENATKERKAKDYLSLFKIQDLNWDIAETLGMILRRKTHVPGSGIADLIIASTAIYLNAQLATRNKLHFKGIPNLRFFDPSSL